MNRMRSLSTACFVRPLSLCRVSRAARFLTQIGYRIAIAAIPLFALGSAQLSESQTTIQVTTTQQGVTDPSHCSLQEAIYAAEFASNTALNLTDPDSFYTTGCVLQGASGPFTIVLQKSVYSFDTFWDRDAHNPFGLTATPIIFANITIKGNGATLEWTGKGNSRLFAVGSASIFDTLDNKTVSGTGALRLEAVYIKGFVITGGSGRCGGAGGLGAGGAIYVGKVDSGVPSLDVEDSTFDSNFAVGGNGSAEVEFCLSRFGSAAGGGGGGLSGNGGGTGTTGGGGGGGGGSRGNGGSGTFGDGGGGGGGTIFDGANSVDQSAGPGGLLCGGAGGNLTSDGHGGSCPGGGGGGGGADESGVILGGGSNGADGNYGGGGGGGGSGTGSLGSGNGGNGGFGGGGAASGTSRSVFSGTHGGNGGFGGGGAFGIGTEIDSHGAPGNAGPFGGGGNGSCCGGGGGALGGAIFNDSGTVFVRNSTFTGNDVDRGEGGVNDAGTDRASRGADAGAAIFSLNGSLVLDNTTISGNFVTGSDNAAGGGVVVMNSGPGASLNVSNTILSRNGSNDCLLKGNVDAKGSGNLILNNNGCPGVAVSADPHLASLALDPRSTIGTPTMALPSDSPAVDAADDSRFLATDQRGVARPQGPHSDIGAFEFKVFSADLTLSSQASAAQVVAGNSFTYTVLLTNHGPDDADGVVFTDLPPAGVTFTSCSSTVGNCTISGGASLNLGTLADGNAVTITIQATLSPTIADVPNLANTPSVTSKTPDPDTTNNSGSAASAIITAIADKTPPAIVISANPLSLWPPNGKMVPVTISGTITDTGSGVNPSSGSFAVSDEYGTVQPADPFTINPDGTYFFTVNLQASRQGSDKDGRQYTISVFAKDDTGNLGSSSIVVSVPHDQGH